MIMGNGLWGHIRWNTLKSGLLLAGFFVLLAVYWFGLCLAFSAIMAPFEAVSNKGSVESTLEIILAAAFDRAVGSCYVPTILMAIWYAVAWRWYRQMISSATGAVHIERRKAPKLYNAIETLAITAGLPMPRIEIMETPELNAYAAGLTPDTATVAVTRGLLDALTPAELEAVLAHEMAHIKNRDVRLMVVALIFAGPITVLGSLVRSCWRSTSGGRDVWDLVWSLGRRSNRESSSWEIPDKEDAAAASAAFVAGVIGLMIALLTLGIAHISAVFSRFGISRAREFMADAGAIELTKNPDALISALSKISGRDRVPLACESLRAMMISSALDDPSYIDSLMATHPPMLDRIDCLVEYAGGRMREARTVRPRPMPAESPWAAPEATVKTDVSEPVGSSSFTDEVRPNFGRRVRPPKVGAPVGPYVPTA